MSKAKATDMEERKGDRKVQYLVAVCVSVATITMGMASAWPTPVIPKFHGNETKVEIDKNQISWMLSMASPGFMAGSFITAFTSDKAGRRATILWSALPYTAGMIILVAAVQSWLLYFTQFLWSFGTGMLSTVFTLYFGEVTDKDIRGSLFLMTRITFNLGTLLMMCIGPFLSYEALSYTLLVLPLCYFLACLWIPESPYYYLKEGKVDLARKALNRLRGYKDSKVLEEDLLQMQSDVKNEMRRSGSIKELLTGKQYRKAVIIATGLKITQIMTGAMTIQQYLGLIMSESGINMKLSTIIIIFGAVKFIVSIMPSVLADRLGRRPLLLFSYTGTGISLAVAGIYFFLMEVIKIDRDIITPYGYVTFVGILGSNIISTIGFQSLIQVIPGEIFPLNVKATAMTSLSVFGGVLSFIVTKGYQQLKDLAGLCGVFWIFAAVAFAGAVFTLWKIPETKGKSLKEIQIMLQGDLYDDDAKLNNVFVKVDLEENGTELEVLNKKQTSED